MAVVVTCEHAGRRIPSAFAERFASAEARAALDSHRGWDPGALEIARALSRRLGGPPVVAQEVSRLLVDCNRSLDHRSLWSEFSRRLPPSARAQVVDQYWRPHREAVRRALEEERGSAPVVHLGVHTFTPVWRGRRRTTDIGLLYDPHSALERRLVHEWRLRLTRAPALDPFRVHLNRPYRGWTDGLVTTLRRELGASRYLGLELEVSQAATPLPRSCMIAIADSLRDAIDALHHV